MSYADALADLQATFGNKKLLTPEDVAPFFGKSAAAQAKLRERERFPIKVRKGLGNRILMSIYDVAHFIGDDVGQADAKPSQSVQRPTRQRPSPRASAGIDKSKPFRRPPSLGATLRGFRSRIETLSAQLAFESALFAELEAILLDQSAKQGSKATRRAL